ncbi:VOC family protein [Novosphingobium album (ex Hu et al. 2023)]|uniref:VOC family protein n=1 Tax=Novosphingobium album (ex Hu et al. 2023) TaxID=2930093 RepID=A0ABT0B458_9SPHN|nr:VOC family protein [Novosphingobium album (ex Hu et al. 2023)]MCJ2179594.1 VOC family protein [Novosphingobium album (ex Hu et al. 2023)]
MANPTGSFIWYELMTSDPDGAAAFYGDVVGWTVSSGSAQAAGIDYRHITRSDGGSAGGMLTLNDEMRAGGARPCWLGYIHVADVDAAVAAIVADGGKVMMPKMTIEVGSFALVTDPEGVPFYVMTPIPPAGDPGATSDVFSPMEAQHVRWNELMANDPDAAIAFYQNHFGWGQEGEMPMGPLGSYRFIQCGGDGIGAVMARMPQAPMPFWTYYIGVDDIDRAIAAVSAGGGSVINGPDQIPGGEFALSGVDPQGATFGLVGPRHN